MRQKRQSKPESAEQAVRDIRRAMRRQHSAEEKIRIVVEGLRGEESIAGLCRKDSINQNLYYRWSKEFLEAGKKRLLMKSSQLTEMLAELMMENRLLKKRARGWGGRYMRYAAAEKLEIIRLVERSKCRPIRNVNQPISAII